MANVYKSNSFLEIGAGNLSLGIDLLTKFNQGTLMDFNTEEVAGIFENITPEKRKKLKLIIADFLTYDKFSEIFDCIVSCDVMEHIENDQAFLTRSYELLRKGGQFILSVPARKKYWSNDDEIVGHFRRYEKKDLEIILKEAGFCDIKIISYGYPFINLSRIIRIWLAKRQYSEKADWDLKKKSQQSAFMVKQNNNLGFISFIMNKYTLYPLYLFSTLFNHLDLSDGYVVIAKTKL